MKHSIVQNQLKLTQKLHSIFPEIKKIARNELDFKQNITNVYYNKKKIHWFFKIEENGRAYYIFGKNKSRNVLLKDNVLLIIDIDLNHEHNPQCMGRLVKIKNQVKLLLNIDVFKKRYPQIDTGMFKMSTITSNKKTSNYIDLGFINQNLISNIENLLLELENTSVKKPVIKSEKDKCEICEKNKTDIKVDHHLHKIYRENPEFCGECLEKIIACEFYAKIKSQLKNNETKTLNIAREKFANDEIFDYGVKLLEKYNILNYIGVKKLLFTIDNKNSVLMKYNRYANKRLLDGIILKNHNPANREFKMNNFLDALGRGKTHEEAYKIAKIHPKTLKLWYNLGHDGNMDYIDFYDRYAQFKPPQKHLKQFIKILRETRNLKSTLKISKTDIKTVREWYDKGKEGSVDYQWFYREFHKILPQGIINSDDELINRYVELRNRGKTNSQAMGELEIPEEKIEEWISEAKNGNKKYSNFYTTYHEKEIRCEVCGRKINKNSTKRICKRCEKKHFASKILMKILKIVEAGKTFKKDELELLNLKPMQIKEYLWTLKEFNLITEKNNKYRLKNKNELEEFLKGSGVEEYEISDDSHGELYRTCVKCMQKLPKSRFINDEDTCKDCKKLINTAKYLTEIMKHVDYNTRFSEDDLKEHFKNPLKLQAMIWALADNNLAKKNFDDDTYTLSDKKTLEDFLKRFGDVENIKTNEDNGIMTPLPEEIEKQLPNKISKTGFAWVNHIGKKYYYTKTHNRQQVKISAATIEELYEKVKSEGEIWGVRNQDNAKATLKTSKSEFKDPGIYEPLSHKYSDKLLKQTKTGIAWVNKSGNNFIYSRTTNGNTLSFKDTDIIELYRKVKSAKEVWGITDYENASKFIEIPENIKKENTIQKEKYSGIYAPLNKRYLKNFRKENETGIAWVNKSGNNYIYTRNVNGKINTISDPDIYKLYRKVKSKNQVWGIRDYEKASKIIDIPEKYIEDNKAENEFYTPLPESYLNECEKTNTGIAWVNKNGDKWVYNLKIQGKIIRLTDTDVYRLHEKVQNNNGIWGIIDIEKAKESVENKKTIKKITKSTNIKVSFIQKTRSQYDSIIKGSIKKTELFEILKELEEYENNIRRIMTTTIKKDVDLFIEMELNRKSKKAFEEKIRTNGWTITN